ncbi:hypothetical protein C8Q76DRAFT_156608 [Earliella scabrosa]|nr:hypothetical protein C8Q76DRAFT_156608 [Earliella scabrosa]
MATRQYDSTLGAGLIGCLLTATLYGVTCVQTLIYYQNADKDTRLIKSAVAILLVLDTIHYIFVAHSIYWYLVQNFTDEDIVGRIPWSIPAGFLVTPTSDTVVRIFFVYRVWVLSERNRILTFPLIVLITLTGGVGLGFAIRGFSLPTFEQFAQIAWWLYLGLGLTVVGDMYVATSLCYLLYRGRTRSSYSTNSLLNVLMLYTINTGLLTSMFSLACFITYAAMPRNFIFLGVYFPLSKLYLNAFLATLNARGHMRTYTENTISVPLPVSPRSAISQPSPLVFAHSPTSTRNPMERGAVGHPEGTKADST